MANYLINKRIAYLSLGCKVNAYETEAMQELLEGLGTITVPFQETAEVYLINTCTVTNIADRKSRQMLHKARKLSPSAVVVAVGCYVQEFYQNHEEDSAIDLLVGNQKKNQIGTILNSYFEALEGGIRKQSIYVDEDKSLATFEELRVSKPGNHDRAYIKIQDGCNQFCSYCIIPFARGRICSRPVEDVLMEAKNLEDAGYKEIVLTGIHLSSYGFDHASVEELKKLKLSDERKPLLEVIRKIAALPEIARIRLGSLEPRIMTEEFVRELSQIEKLCAHFHLSLQSGSNDTLKNMNRHYTADEYYDSVLLLRKYFDNPAITTDMIVGFPKETDETFLESMEFAKKVAFSQIHVFPFSRRKGTVADKMLPQVTDERKKKREHSLLLTGAVCKHAYEQLWVGRNVELLVEEVRFVDGKRLLIGHTREYLMVGVFASEGKNGDLLTLCINGTYYDNYLLGDIVK